MDRKEWCAKFREATNDMKEAALVIADLVADDSTPTPEVVDAYRAAVAKWRQVIHTEVTHAS